MDKELLAATASALVLHDISFDYNPREGIFIWGGRLPWFHVTADGVEDAEGKKIIPESIEDLILHVKSTLH